MVDNTKSKSIIAGQVIIYFNLTTTFDSFLEEFCSIEPKSQCTQLKNKC